METSFHLITNYQMTLDEYKKFIIEFFRKKKILFSYELNMYTRLQNLDDSIDHHREPLNVHHRGGKMRFKKKVSIIITLLFGFIVIAIYFYSKVDESNENLTRSNNKFHQAQNHHHHSPIDDDAIIHEKMIDQIHPPKNNPQIINKKKETAPPDEDHQLHLEPVIPSNVKKDLSKKIVIPRVHIAKLTTMSNMKQIRHNLRHRGDNRTEAQRAKDDKIHHIRRISDAFKLSFPHIEPNLLDTDPKYRQIIDSIFRMSKNQTKKIFPTFNVTKSLLDDELPKCQCLSNICKCCAKLEFKLLSMNQLLCVDITQETVTKTLNFTITIDNSTVGKEVISNATKPEHIILESASNAIYCELAIIFMMPTFVKQSAAGCLQSQLFVRNTHIFTTNIGLLRIFKKHKEI
ncbi:hypothetical protein SNEBB_010235 [Seison nebaliae]|nr:hypothetical protein SNEBB_010235 [Seison nebaliae]